jgi:hypothetical protein
MKLNGAVLVICFFGEERERETFYGVNEDDSGKMSVVNSSGADRLGDGLVRIEKK